MRRLRARWSRQLSGDDNDDHENDCSDDEWWIGAGDGSYDELVVAIMVMMMLVAVDKWGNHSRGMRVRWTLNSDGDDTSNKWMNP